MPSFRGYLERRQHPDLAPQVVADDKSRMQRHHPRLEESSRERLDGHAENPRRGFRLALGPDSIRRERLYVEPARGGSVENIPQAAQTGAVGRG